MGLPIPGLPAPVGETVIQIPGLPPITVPVPRAATASTAAPTGAVIGQ